MNALAPLFDRVDSADERRRLRFVLGYPVRPCRADQAAVARLWPRLSPEDRLQAERMVQVYARYIERSGTPRRLVPWAAQWLSLALYREDWGTRTEPATDLGRCQWNSSGVYVGAGQCDGRAHVIHRGTGAMYCAKHGRALGLVVRGLA